MDKLFETTKSIHPLISHSMQRKLIVDISSHFIYQTLNNGKYKNHNDPSTVIHYFKQSNQIIFEPMKYFMMEQELLISSLIFAGIKVHLRSELICADTNWSGY